MTTGAALRVVVWHRHRFVREALAESLRREPFVAAAVPAPSLEDVCELTRQHGATTCLADLDDPSSAQWAVIEELASAWDVRVVGMTDRLDPTQAQRAYLTGVRGIVEAGDGLAGILAELRPAGWRSTSFREDRASTPQLDALERDVLRLIGRGLTARAVASELGVSTAKVDSAKRRIFAKLGVQQQAHAVAVAIGAGLLEEPRQI
jgi:DNA-binding NarL/FixJ family response regulator